MIPEWIRATITLLLLACAMWGVICVLTGRLPKSVALRSVLFVVLVIHVAAMGVHWITGWRPLAIWPEGNEYVSRLADWAEGK